MLGIYCGLARHAARALLHLVHVTQKGRTAAALCWKTGQVFYSSRVGVAPVKQNPLVCSVLHRGWCGSLHLGSTGKATTRTHARFMVKHNQRKDAKNNTAHHRLLTISSSTREAWWPVYAELWKNSIRSRIFLLERSTPFPDNQRFQAPGNSSQRRPPI